MAFGIDYSFGSGVTATQIKASGAQFVARYLSNPGNPKNITKAEFDNLVNAGLKVVLVYEYRANDILRGHAGGVADANSAEAQVKALGADGIPIYFACDFDATPGDQAAINAYLDGVASVITWKRTGLYSGYWPMKRAFDAGKMKYGWQARAWSGINVESRAHIYQYAGGKVGPADVDFNRILQSEYGAWPRPSKPKPIEQGPYRHTGDGKHTLLEIVAARHGNFAKIIDLSFAHLNEKNAAKLTAYLAPGGGIMPAGLVYWTAGKSGAKRHVADGTESLAKVARDRHTTVDHLVSVSNTYLNSKNKAKLQAYLRPGGGITPKDLVYYTINK